jgi:tripartite-type tricarboxylate transporter receptor subunit TctC
MNTTRRHLLGAAVATLGSSCLPAIAQTWPSGPVKLVSPYGAGGASDILTRILGQYFEKALGQPFVVENKAGAGTRIANELVANAAPDGSVLLHAAAPIAIGAALYPKLPYDVRTSFAPIVSTAIAPLFLIVNADSRFGTLGDLLAYGRSHADGLTFGSPGAASAPHLTAELLFSSAKVRGINIHHRGDATAYVELLAGRIDATLTSIAAAVPHIKAGKLRVLAVATEERTPVYPQALTFREQGLPDVVGYGWYGLVAPAGTPPAVIQRMNTVANQALADAAIREKAQAAGLQPRGGTPVEFAAFIDAESRKWAEVIRSAKITVE